MGGLNESAMKTERFRTRSGEQSRYFRVGDWPLVKLIFSSPLEQQVPCAKILHLKGSGEEFH